MDRAAVAAAVSDLTAFSIAPALLRLSGKIFLAFSAESFIIVVHLGELAERFKAPSWKGGDVKASVSSNLMLSASENKSPYVIDKGFFLWFSCQILISALLRFGKNAGGKVRISYRGTLPNCRSVHPTAGHLPF